MAEVPSLSGLMASGGDIVNIHMSGNYPEIYVKVSEPVGAVFICRVAGEATAFQQFFDYRQNLPPSEIPTVCAELK